MDDVADRTKAGARPPARYEDDTYSWAVEQAALLRAGRLADIDARNIAEELDDVGNELYFKLESALRIILIQLLKWDHQPARRGSSWRASILVQRKHVARLLRKNPGLKSELGTAIADGFDDARLEASGETDLDLSTFPEACPWSFEEIMTRPVDWPPAEGGRDG